MNQPCDLCGDSYKVKADALKNIRQSARAKATEEKKTIAICEDETNKSFFTADPFTAFEQRFKIVDIISGS